MPQDVLQRQVLLQGFSLQSCLAGVRAVGVLEKDVSFGAEGTVYTNVNSALMRGRLVVPTLDFVGGLGGDDITAAQVEEAFQLLEQCAAGGDVQPVTFLGVSQEVSHAR